jgi:hypothetical protein
MPGKIRVKVNDKAVKEIREGKEMARELEKHARRVANRANQMLGDADNPEGFHAGAPLAAGEDRTTVPARASIFAFTNHAKRADAKRGLLLRALFGA